MYSQVKFVFLLATLLNPKNIYPKTSKKNSQTSFCGKEKKKTPFSDWGMWVSLCVSCHSRHAKSFSPLSFLLVFKILEIQEAAIMRQLILNLSN